MKGEGGGRDRKEGRGRNGERRRETEPGRKWSQGNVGGREMVDVTGETGTK